MLSMIQASVRMAGLGRSTRSLLATVHQDSLGCPYSFIHHVVLKCYAIIMQSLCACQYS